MNRSFIVGITAPEDEEENFFNGFNMFAAKSGFTVEGLMERIVKEIEATEENKKEFEGLKNEIKKI